MAAELQDMGNTNGSLCSGKAERPLLKAESSASESLVDNRDAAKELEEMEKRYSAFVRMDAYGVMGRGKLRAAEKARLGIAMVTLVPIRLVLGIFILVVYYAVCRICTLFSAPNRGDGQEDYAHMAGWRRKAVVQSGRFLTRAMLFNFGFYWIKDTRLYLSGDECREQSDVSKRPGVIVSNHVSYLDILYHMSSSFPSFVAKRSVAKLPLVGIISKCLGCVFVQRESKDSDFKGVSGVVTERIQEAHKNKHAPIMLLFPEGTTTNGYYLLPFKRGAFVPKVPVLPVIIRYPYRRFSPAWDSISGLLDPEFARIIVEMDLMQKHSPEIWIGNAEMGYTQHVAFEDMPSYCSHCRKYGHSLDSCFIKYPELRKARKLTTVKKDDGRQWESGRKKRTNWC